MIFAPKVYVLKTFSKIKHNTKIISGFNLEKYKRCIQEFKTILFVLKAAVSVE
jgi:hypothetical protein